jgi:hypothetical protein
MFDHRFARQEFIVPGDAAAIGTCLWLMVKGVNIPEATA